MNYLDRYLITLDVDWASDKVIGYVSDILLCNKVKATWFITHDSPAIRKLTALERTIHTGGESGE